MEVDKALLKDVYDDLRDSNPELALEVADLLLGENILSPDEWVKYNLEDYEKKIPMIRKVQSIFGMNLRNAKEVVDGHWVYE